ncbi:MAG: hypothetical protein KKH94_03670 [Candidatus Omnitrophica bacterium]|nr:hypothetical protein [Candidatus Omnitrophota bacterium]
MDDQTKGKEKVTICAGCPLCTFTRRSIKKTLFYRIARLVQSLCPCCRAANQKLGKNFQEGTSVQ